MARAPLYWLDSFRLSLGLGLVLGALVGILVGSAAVRAQDPGQQMPTGGTSVPGRGLILGIDGRVVRGPGGSNVAGARVMLTDSRGSIRIAQTRDGGSFQFSSLIPGRYTLTASHPEFGEYTETVELISNSVTGLLLTLSRDSPPPETLQPSVPSWALNVPEKAQQEFNRGLEALEKGEDKRAMEHMRKAIAIYPRFAASYAALGSVQQNLQENEAAARSFAKAIEIDDTLASAWLGLGTLHAVAGRRQEAERHLLRARVLRPDDWQAWYQLGELYGEMGDAARTEENARRARDLHGSMPRIHVLLINALVGQEKYPEALTAMDTFLAEFPTSPLAKEVAHKRDLLRAELQRNVP